MNIKQALISIIALLGVSTSGFTQAEKLQPADYIRIESERKTISSELNQLRDSMVTSMRAFDSKINRSSHSRGKELKALRKELDSYKERLEFDLAEIDQTRRNSWSKASVQRIYLATINTRREYNRIRTSL